MKTLRIPRGNFNAVCYSADGKYLLGLYSCRRLRIWATSDFSERFVGTLDGPLPGHESMALAGNLAVMNRGVYDLAAVWPALSDSACVRLHLIRELSLGKKPGTFGYVDYSTNGRMIIRREHNHSTRQFHLTCFDVTGRRLHSLSLPLGYGWTPLAISPDGRTLAVVDNRAVRLHDRTTGSEIRRFTHSDAVERVAFSPDGKYLATGAGRSLWLWEMDTETGRRFPAYQKFVVGLAFHPEGKLLAASDRTGEIRLIEPSSGRQHACLNFEVGSLRDLAFSPDGMTVAGAGNSNVVVWDVE